MLSGNAVTKWYCNDAITLSYNNPLCKRRRSS